MESSRYCNYSKDKFGNELTFIIPSWSEMKPTTIYPTGDILTDGEQLQKYEEVGKTIFWQALIYSEVGYLTMLNQGFTPQQARQVLPMATKCDIVMTGFESDWEYFFDLRLKGTTGKPHPDMVELAKKIKKEIDENK